MLFPYVLVSQFLNMAMFRKLCLYIMPINLMQKNAHVLFKIDIDSAFIKIKINYLNNFLINLGILW